MNASRPIASLSVDLDDRWTYLKTRGAEDWESAPSFLPGLIPRVLDFLAQRELRATFFVIGRSAQSPRLRHALRALADAGHEIGNHSLTHEPWFHLFDRARTLEEIAVAEDAIAQATGTKPIGFRGPGHSVTDVARGILAERDYLYDASPLRTFAGPLIRWLYFRDVPLSAQQRQQRARLGGSFADGFGSNRPRRIAVDGRCLVEIPVTVFPALRLPMHFTYLQILEGAWRGAGERYFDLAAAACRLARTPPSLLLHATDFLGAEDDASMPFFPATSVPVAQKLEFLGRCLDRLARHYRLVPLRDQASTLPGVDLAPTGATEART